MIITVNTSHSHFLPEQTHQQFAKPYDFVRSYDNCHILCFCWAQCYWLLLPTTPRDHPWSNVEAVHGDTFHVHWTTTWSASANSLNLKSSPLVYFNPSLNVPRTYLRMFLDVSQCTLFNSTMNWLRVLIDKQMCSLTLTRYMSDPISCLYTVGLTSLSLEAYIFFPVHNHGYWHGSSILHSESLYNFL